jgi:hypothetical protein
VKLQIPFRFILVGLINMIMVCSLAIKFFDRHNAVLVIAHGDVALTNDMLKGYKVGKAYEYFSSGWLQEGYFLKATGKSNNNNLCILFLRTKCSPSQTLDDDHTMYRYCANSKKMMV